MTLFSRIDRLDRSTHELRTHSKCFVGVDRGMSLIKVRDRGQQFKEGDILELREWNLHLSSKAVAEYSGRRLRARVTRILKRTHPKYFSMHIKVLRPWYVSLAKRVRFELQLIRSSFAKRKSQFIRGHSA